MHTYIHIHMNMYICTYINTYIHTYRNKTGLHKSSSLLFLHKIDNKRKLTIKGCLPTTILLTYQL